jgi:hypothetical protein
MSTSSVPLTAPTSTNGDSDSTCPLLLSGPMRSAWLSVKRL